MHTPDPTVGTQIIKRLASLKTARWQIDNIRRQCFEVTYPIRGVGFSQPGSVLDQNMGRAESYSESKQPEIYDSTAPEAVDILAAGLVSGLTSAASRWFGLSQEGGEEDQDQAATKWLDVSADKLFGYIHSSNFDAVAFECMIDTCIAGQFAMFVDEDPEGGFLFDQWPLAQCYFACTKPGGPVDTIYREFSMTLQQIAGEYGVESLGTALRAKWDEATKVNGNPALLDETHEIVWAIYPRTGGTASKFGHRLPFASCHVVSKDKHILRENGFHEFPVVAPRWMVVPGSIYATGPIYKTMAHVKTVNELVKLELLALDVAATGMWGAVDDGVLNARTVKLGPRKIIVMASKDSFFPLNSGADFKATLLTIAELQNAIKRIMMADHLQVQDKPNMTAFEVHVRVEMIRQLLGPIYGRMQAEYLSPLVQRCFGIAYRAGALGKAPESMVDGGLPRVKYLSPIARAQKLVDVAAMDRYETTLAQEEKVRPGVADNYDWDAATRKRRELLGVPADLEVDQDIVEKIRAQRAEVAKQSAEAEAMKQGQGAAPAGAWPTMGEGAFDANVGLGATQ